MIKVEGITKRYGSKLAVDNVSFEVGQGEVVGFLGRNGAGKTTTMNILTGYISSSAGSASIDGHDILAEPQEVKRRIGYLPEQPPVYLDMTVDEAFKAIVSGGNYLPEAIGQSLQASRQLGSPAGSV